MEGVSQGFLLHLSRLMVFPFTQTVYLANDARNALNAHMLCEYVILPVRAQLRDAALRSF